jgi:4-amino-4-deoxy-L-arabinose transferase-like glycosyltransferase
MFGSAFGTEISWLLPAALIALVGGLWLTRRAPRTDLVRAGLVLWGGWLLVTAGVFSFMSGTIHPYYAVALAPAIGGLVGMGVFIAWKERASLAARLTLAAMVLATGVWDYVLLARTSDFLPWAKYVVLAGGVVAALLVVVGWRVRRALPAVVLAVVVSLGLGSTAYAAATASQTHNGSIPTSGPTSSAMGGGSSTRGAGGPGGTGAPTGTPPNGTSGDGGGMGGDASASSELTALLSSTTTTWAAATSGSQSAASLELATGKSVIAIGGFSGTDDAPTLAQFKQWVAEGKISYYISGGQGGGGRGGSSSAAGEIQSWVESNYTATTVGTTTIYKLTT